MRAFLRSFIYVIMLVTFTGALYGCSDEQETRGKPLMSAEKVRIKTSKGDIVLTLDADKAPITVDNFLRYAKAGFYDGTIFHRVIPGFMVQGGGFDTSFDQKATQAPIENEADNGLKNSRGSIAMARTSDPHSATAQFFINLVDNDFLNYRAPNPQGYGYTVFGHVDSGLEVIDAIAKVPTGSRMGHQDVPTEEVVIESVTIEE